jgi:hypothetical protein
LALEALQARIAADGIDRAFRLRLPELQEVYDSIEADRGSKKGGDR